MATVASTHGALRFYGRILTGTISRQFTGGTQLLESGDPHVVNYGYGTFSRRVFTDTVIRKITDGG